MMFRSKKSVHDTAWIFSFDQPSRSSITMANVRFPIDLLFLDNRKRVIEIALGLKPWRHYTPKMPFRHFIELEAGTVKKNIKKGDRLHF